MTAVQLMFSPSRLQVRSYLCFISLDKNGQRVKSWHEWGAIQVKGGASFFFFSPLAPCQLQTPLLPFLERRDMEKACQLPWVALPQQTGYHQVAFWDSAGKVQTQCFGQDLVATSPTSAQPTHLPSRTHLLTVWSVSSPSRDYFFFLPFHFSTS